MSPDYYRTREEVAALRDKYQSPSIDDLSRDEMLGDIQWLLFDPDADVCAGLAERVIRMDPDNRYDRDGYYSK
jgi:hypothetical protein